MLFCFSSRRRHTRYWRDWSSDVCSSDLVLRPGGETPELRPGSRQNSLSAISRGATPSVHGSGRGQERSPEGWATPSCRCPPRGARDCRRSEEHTSELQSRQYLVCRLLLEKKKNLN